MISSMSIYKKVFTVLLLNVMAIFLTKQIIECDWDTKEAHMMDNENQQEGMLRSNLKMEMRWTVLVTVNDGFIDFFYNWLWHFDKLSLRNNVIVVAEDEVVYKKLHTMQRKGIHVKLSKDATIGNKSLKADYNTSNYNVIVSKRPRHILDALQETAYVLYVDLDSVWLANPMPYLNMEEVDILAQLERWDKDIFCTGLLAVKRSNRTLAFFEKWDQMLAKQKRPVVNQGLFNFIARERFANIRIKGLNREYFPSGWMYFSMFNDTQRKHVAVVHNNWIVGYNKKLARFKEFGLWRYNERS